MTNHTTTNNTRLWLHGIALLCACAVLHCGEAGPSLEPLPLGEQPAELALYPSNPQIAYETGQQFSLRGVYADGRARALTSAASWQVADESGHTLSIPAAGYVELAQPGRYVVSARYQDRLLSTSIVVTAATVKSVAISPSSPRVAKGLTQAFTATATFTDGTTQDVTTMATWAVKDVLGTGVATVDTTGVMLAKNVGKATITTRYKSHSSSTTAEVVAATLNTLSLSPADPTIANGTSQHFTATGTYSDGSVVDLTTAATWAVTDVVGTGVAAIDGAGNANGKAVGTAQVSADYAGLSAETSLTVIPAVPVTVAITPSSSSIAKGTSTNFSAIATLTDGTTQDVTAMATWKSTDKTGIGVASIDSSGVAKGNAEGTATISCVYRGNSATALLTVTPAVLSGLAVAPTSASIFVGAYANLKAIGTYTDGTTQDLSATALWAAADLMGTGVASVDASGKVFGKSAGRARITATSGLYTASAIVDVAVPTYTALTVTSPLPGTIIGLPLPCTATATLSDGSTRNVTSMVTWSASDVVGTGVATVDSRGIVTAHAVGTTEIKAVLGALSATTQIIVLF